jgi:anti-sigma regulatory factor (Ser/Thr protein kinase)
MDAHDARGDPFVHIGLLYRTAQQYADGCAAFVRRALDAGEPVMVAVPVANGALIRIALCDDARRVEFADMKAAGRNPGRIIPWMLLAFAAHHAGRRVSIISEPIWPGRTSIEYPACAVHEALINTAFHGRDAAILCPYDQAGLDPVMVHDASLTHPTMADSTGTWASPIYDDPIRTAANFNIPLPPPPDTAVRLTYASAVDLPALRTRVAAYATVRGLEAGKIAELVLAVNELAANTIDHTATGHGVLSMWTEPGMLVCQIDDEGRLTDPMAGRVPPDRRSSRGRGLLLVQQVVDLLRIHTRPDGMSLRLHAHLAGYVPA